MPNRPRRLFLHFSALSDDEYGVYSGALRDVLDLDGAAVELSEDELEGKEVGVREVRAWMKGRYRDTSDIDKIIRMFSPDLSPKDNINGGQFLAAMRLLMHAQHGEGVTEGNVFVQANPSQPTQINDRRSPMSAGPVPFIDPPSTDTGPTSTNPFDPNFPPSSPPHVPIRRSSISHFDPQQPQQQRYPDPSWNGLSAGTANPSDLKQGAPARPSSSTNPFLQRSKTHSGSARVVSRSSDGAVPSSVSTNLPNNASGLPLKTPPLPPRKPSHISRPSIPSIPSASLFTSTSSSIARTGANNRSPPKSLQPLPPQHPPLPAKSMLSPSANSTPSLISPLMKQSLEASKAGQTLKKVQQQLEKERVLEVLQSSATSASTSRSVSNDSAGQRVPVLNTRRPVPSPPRSTTSLEQVASARLANRNRMESPDRMSSSQSQGSNSPPASLPISSPPPTHPHRRASGGHRHSSSLHQSPTDTRFSSTATTNTETSPGDSRSGRSQSVHHPGRISPPAPPVRKKRPESVQVGRSATAADGSYSPFSDHLASSSSTAKFSPLKSSSLFTDEKSPSPQQQQQSSDSPLTFSALQRAFSQLQSKAQPSIDRAKYKAEAGLAPRRGYMAHAHHGHGQGGEGAHSGLLQDDDGDDGEGRLTTDDGLGGVLEMSSDETGDGWDEGTIRARVRDADERRGRNRDNLKMPEGEGWAQL